MTTVYDDLGDQAEGMRADVGGRGDLQAHCQPLECRDPEAHRVAIGAALGGGRGGEARARPERQSRMAAEREADVGMGKKARAGIDDAATPPPAISTR